MLQKIQQCGGVTCQGGRIPGRLRLQQGQQSHPEWHLPEKKAKFSLQAILQGVFHRIVLVVRDFRLHHRVQLPMSPEPGGHYSPLATGRSCVTGTCTGHWPGRKTTSAAVACTRAFQVQSSYLPVHQGI